MMSKKGLDTVFPFEDTENDTTGTVLEYRPLSTQPTGGPQVSDWAKEQVSKAAETGLVPDSLGSDYRVSVTRAQFAATAVKLYEAMSGQKAPAAGESPFTDTSDPAVIQAQALGIVSGVGDNSFDPLGNASIEQALVIALRMFDNLK